MEKGKRGEGRDVRNAHLVVQLKRAQSAVSMLMCQSETGTAGLEVAVRLSVLHLKPKTDRIKRPGRAASVWLIRHKVWLFSSAEIVLLDLVEVEFLTFLKPPLLQKCPESMIVQGIGLHDGAPPGGDGEETEGARGPSPRRSGAEAGENPAGSSATVCPQPGIHEQPSGRIGPQRRSRGDHPDCSALDLIPRFWRDLGAFSVCGSSQTDT